MIRRKFEIKVEEINANVSLLIICFCVFPMSEVRLSCAYIYIPASRERTREKEEKNRRRGNADRKYIKEGIRRDKCIRVMKSVTANSIEDHGRI